MRKKGYFKFFYILIALVMLLSVGGVFSAWVYGANPATVESKKSPTISKFTYGLLYITEAYVSGGSYSSASIQKTDETVVDLNLTLNAVAGSSVTFAITFYNSTDVIYYFDKVETLSSNNDGVAYSLAGVVQEDAVAPGAYRSVTLTLRFAGNDYSNPTYQGVLNFKFTIDKDSIGEVVATTAVEKFEEILNGTDENGSPNIKVLSDAMSAKAEGSLNASSSVTYIGNVAGADTGDGGDSETINNLFGDDLMHIDLDGDGVEESVSMMIKRENLDPGNLTGGSYTYTTTDWFGNTSESREDYVEMTIYITAETFENVSRGDEIIVYASSYTILPGESSWVQVVPLTEGRATANNYTYGNWRGEANSFDTDTWTVAGATTTMKELFVEKLALMQGA